MRISRTQAAIEKRRLIVCRLLREGVPLRLIAKAASGMLGRNVSLGTVFSDATTIRTVWVPKARRLGGFFDPPEVHQQRMNEVLATSYRADWLADRRTRDRLAHTLSTRRSAIVGWDAMDTGLMDVADVIRNEENLKRGGEWPPPSRWPRVNGRR